MVRLNWRLYRLSLVPVLAAVVIAAFSFGQRAAPLRTTHAPEAFEGAAAMALLREMEAIAPSRQVGSRGERKLLELITRKLEAFGGFEKGGYEITFHEVPEDTPNGHVVPLYLVAGRPGTATERPIVLLASRDALQPRSAAQLSGTAALLELATVLASAETTHPVVIVFSDGASAGVSQVASVLQEGVGAHYDAAIVLGDVAGRTLSPPISQPFSTSFGSAPEQLQSTVSAALRSELGSDPGTPSLVAQLAHFAFPLTTGEQGRLNAVGLPAVSVDLAGEGGAPAGEAVSEARMQNVGRAVLSAFYALDAAGESSRAPTMGLTIASQTLPAWAVRLLIFTMMLGPLAVAFDAAVRMVRRGHRIGPWLWFVSTFAWPFAIGAGALKAVAAIGIMPSPPGPAPAAAISFGIGPLFGVLLAAAVFALSWRMWRTFADTYDRIGIPASGIAGVGSLSFAAAFALLIWVLDPYTALLLVPALHCWLVLVSPQHQPPTRAARLALALGPLLPLALVILYYALALGLGPWQTLIGGAMMIGGGYLSVVALVLWCIAFGLFVAMSVIAIAEEGVLPERIRETFEGRIPVLYPGEKPVWPGEPRPPRQSRQRPVGSRDER